MSVFFLNKLCFIEIPVINANSVDPDQTPRPAASDLGLYCFPVPILWGARHKWFGRSDYIKNGLISLVKRDIF